MSLSTFFSLSGKNLNAFTYDAANPNAPHAYASLYIHGGYFVANRPRVTLYDQYNLDAPVIGYDAVLPGSPLFSVNINPWRTSSLILFFDGYNVTDQNQYLLLYQLRGIQGEPSVEFFVGDSLVSTVALTIGQDEQHAILLECPGMDYLSDEEPQPYSIRVIARLVSPQYYSIISFQGLDCFLL